MMKWTKCAIRFLRISRPGVRVPSIAPRKTRTRLCSGFSFCQHDGRGSNRAAARSAASNQPSGLLLSPRVPTCRNVYRGSCEIERFHGFFCFFGRGCTHLHTFCTLYKKAMNSLHRLHSVYFAAQKRIFYAKSTRVSSRRSSASICRMASRIILPVIFVATGILFSMG